jgi:hypothetical protein
VDVIQPYSRWEPTKNINITCIAISFNWINTYRKVFCQDLRIDRMSPEGRVWNNRIKTGKEKRDHIPSAVWLTRS